MKSNVEAVYISAGCNRSPKSLDWGGSESQIIYAFNNSIALMSREEPYEINCTFNKHTDRVNCVKWIQSIDDLSRPREYNEFFSASKDKSVILWQGKGQQYEAVQVLQGHTNTVCLVDAMYYLNEETKQFQTIMASSSVDSTVRVWSRFGEINSKSASLFNANADQVIRTKTNGFALALKFFMLPLSKLPMLLIGYENHKIEIHVQLHNEKENNYSFYCLHTLIGHEDWIRDLDVVNISNEQLLIASCSQDNYIRLWKLDSAIKEKLDDDVKRVVEEDVNSEQNGQLDDQNQNGNDAEEVDDEDEDENSKNVDKMDNELKLKSSLFTIHSKRLNKYVEYSMNLESVLYGHEDWIYTVKFQPKLNSHSKQPLVLISASIDKTIVVWKYDEENSIWFDSARAGDIGGNTLGFYGATFSPTGDSIVAHGYQGALHLWKRSVDPNGMTEKLRAGVINGGHFDIVEDISWEPEQQYFVSVSNDQSTRFHGKWKRENGVVSWHELGRPQIHGYDLTCVSFIDRFRFVSGADEKLLRVFEAPKIFLKNFYNLCLDDNLLKSIESTSLMPQGASIPALGLSNKAVYDNIDQKTHEKEEKKSKTDELYKEVYFNVIDLNKPPTEEHLLQNTLWPEIQKLYGHGFELFTVAVDHKTKLLASACKASKAEHANILIWQLQNVNNETVYRQVNSLRGHELTIVQMKFSHSGKYLLSVSRDRSWKLFDCTDAQTATFSLVRSIGPRNPFHSRIIWSCDWSHDDNYFMTASRDKRLYIWHGVQANSTNDESEKPVSANGKTSLDLNESITACAFAPSLVTNETSYLIAVGLESGRIELYTWNQTDGFASFSSIEPRFSHHMTVKKLSFNQHFDRDTRFKSFLLASCSDDCSVRLYKVYESS